MDGGCRDRSTPSQHEIHPSPTPTVKLLVQALRPALPLLSTMLAGISDETVEALWEKVLQKAARWV